MEFRYVICDVFTDTPLAGNQLAVFTDARLIPEKLLQAIAREMNLSETVFVYPAVEGGHARIRIFTPFNELPFAGHPVLGSAFVLAAPLQLPTIVLETGLGLVPIVLERDGPRITFGRMTQPLPTITPEPAATAIVDPTDRSTPLVAITNVIPIATSNTVESWRSTFHRLPAVAKFGVNNTFARTRMTSVPIAAYSERGTRRHRLTSRCSHCCCRPRSAGSSRPG